MTQSERVGRLSAAFVALSFAATAAGQTYAKRSPFTGVRWADDRPEVRVDGRWYEPVEIDGVAVVDVLAFCKEHYKAKWQKRFGEDLVQVLSEMGHSPGTTVPLDLRELDTGKQVILTDVPNTAANRKAIMDAKYAGDGPKRVERGHAAAPDPAFEFLLKQIESDGAAAAVRLTARAAAEDLDELEWHIEHRFAYATRKGVDYRAALDAIRAGLGDNISRGAFAVQLMKLLALFGDGHSGIEAAFDLESHRTVAWQDLLPPGYAPFLIGDDDGRLFVFQQDRSGFWDDELPYLRSIDGVPVARWLAAAAHIVAQGSPPYVRYHARRNLRHVGYLRAELDLPAEDRLRIELESRDGMQTRTVDVPIVDRRAIYGPWPRTESRSLPGNIGYLRIEWMANDRRSLDGLAARMREFRDTDGLLIDVRGNGGGSRAALRTLLPYFLSDDEAPRVVNVAAYRLAPGQRENTQRGHLADRTLFPRGWPRWNDRERMAIDRFAASFQPEWQPPVDAFSGWHYMVVDRTDGKGAFRYEKPAAVLMDSGCFSATDIFLAAFKGLDNVTLVGTPSGGGSGRAQNTVALAHSRLLIRFSSMASFQPTGELYDGNGVLPDVVARPQPNDALGRTDTMLDAALARLRGGKE